jgi:hypothetical protein
MAEQKGRYSKLQYLDVTDQPAVFGGENNVVKKALRNAINANREDDVKMRELLNLMDSSCKHIDMIEVKRAARKRTADAQKHKMTGVA